MWAWLLMRQRFNSFVFQYISTLSEYNAMTHTPCPLILLFLYLAGHALAAGSCYTAAYTSITWYVFASSPAVAMTTLFTVAPGNRSNTELQNKKENSPSPLNKSVLPPHRKNSMPLIKKKKCGGEITHVHVHSHRQTNSLSHILTPHICVRTYTNTLFYSELYYPQSFIKHLIICVKH